MNSGGTPNYFHIKTMYTANSETGCKTIVIRFLNCRDVGTIKVSEVRWKKKNPFDEPLDVNAHFEFQLMLIKEFKLLKIEKRKARLVHKLSAFLSSFFSSDTYSEDSW